MKPSYHNGGVTPVIVNLYYSILMETSQGISGEFEKYFEIFLSDGNRFCIPYRTLGVDFWHTVVYGYMDCVNFGSEFILNFNGCVLWPNITGRRWGPMGGPPQGCYRTPRLSDCRLWCPGLDVIGNVL